MRNSALKWLVSLVLPTAVATVTATVFVLSVTHTPRDETAAPDKSEDIAKLQAATGQTIRPLRVRYRPPFR